jgi:hypothetical protein
MSEAKLYGVGTYKRKPYAKAGLAHKAYPNYLCQVQPKNVPICSVKVQHLVTPN